MKLIEKNLTIDQALEVFSLLEVPDARELKQIYNKLSKENHPDLGGSDDAMAMVNGAYETLSHAHAGTKKADSYEDRKAKQEDEIERKHDQWLYMQQMFEDSFDTNEIVDYLSQFSEDDLGVQAKEKPFNEYMSSYSTVYYDIDIEVYNDDHTLVYFVKYMISPVNNSGGLSSDNLDADELSYDFSIVTDVYFNSRKQKLSQAKYQTRKGKKVLFDYEEVFPSAKLKKIFSGATGKKVFKRADFELGLRRELHDCRFSIDKDMIYIYPFDSKRTYLSLGRYTMMRTAGYSFHNLWSVDPVTGKNKSFRFSAYKTLEETEEAMKSIIKSIKQVQDIVEKHNINVDADGNVIRDLFQESFDNNLVYSY